MNIIYIGDSKSVFCKQDIEILSRHNKVTDVLIDLIKKDYFDMLRIGIFKIIPGVWKNDISITWTADYHTLVVVLLSKLFGKKSVVIIAGHEVSNIPEIGYGYQRLLIRGTMVRIVLKLADKIISPSETYKQKRFVNTNKTIVIPNSVDFNIPINTNKDMDVMMVANQYIDNNSFVLLKGISVYNEIAKILSDNKFYLIGKVNNSIKEKYKHIIYLDGMEHDMVLQYLLRSKVYCQLSYTESFGVALLEGIQAGCIPVVTNKDGMKDLVKNNGYMISYGDIDGGVVAIKNAFKDNRDRTQIIKEYSKQYSKEDRIINFENLIRSLEET